MFEYYYYYYLYRKHNIFIKNILRHIFFFGGTLLFFYYFNLFVITELDLRPNYYLCEIPFWLYILYIFKFIINSFHNDCIYYISVTNYVHFNISDELALILPYLKYLLFILEILYNYYFWFFGILLWAVVSHLHVIYDMQNIDHKKKVDCFNEICENILSCVSVQLLVSVMINYPFFF